MPLLFKKRGGADEESFFMLGIVRQLLGADSYQIVHIQSLPVNIRRFKNFIGFFEYFLQFLTFGTDSGTGALADRALLRKVVRLLASEHLGHILAWKILELSLFLSRHQLEMLVSQELVR